MTRHFRTLLLAFPLVLTSACAVATSSESKASSAAVASAPDDPYLWLEDVHAERSLAWARAHNAKSTGELVDADFHALETRLKAILDSKEKIPYVAEIG